MTNTTCPIHNQIHQQLESNLAHHLKCLGPELNFNETLHYALIPAGKLFRPKLALAMAQTYSAGNLCEKKLLDQLKKPYSTLSLICSAIETHHSYTLVHDDLPSMDNDDTRRGKPSCHKKYGIWQALLAGDALLHHSHFLIGKVKSDNHYQLRQFFNWPLGARGLILGQVYDLSKSAQNDMNSLIRTHELKTARLIQSSLLCGAWSAVQSSQKKLSFKDIKKLLKLGRSLGIAFQLIDDLSELTEDLSEHERSINPFLTEPKACLNILSSCLENLETFESKHFKVILHEYFSKMRAPIIKDLTKENSLIAKTISEHIEPNELTALLS